jgi:hypothetical protein
MADGHKLEIFRGLVKFKSNIQKIWGVLAFLTFITVVEVALGIIKPEWMMKPLLNAFDGSGFWVVLNVILSPLISMKFLNLLFILLTLVKAYYIAWDFMHLRDEKTALRRAIVWTPIFLVMYLVFILLVEADYIYNIYKDGFVTWNF